MLAMWWEDKIFIDSMIPFGLSSAPRFSALWPTPLHGSCIKPTSLGLGIIWMTSLSLNHQIRLNPGQRVSGSGGPTGGPQMRWPNHLPDIPRDRNRHGCGPAATANRQAAPGAGPTPRMGG